MTRAPASSRWRTTPPPTCPAPCTATRTPSKLVADSGLLDRGPHAAEDAPRRHRRGIAGAALLDREAGDVARLARDDLGVGGRRADVLGRQVAAAERLDEPPQRPEQELALLRARIADDHRLAAAEREPGRRVLVGHPPRQAQDVGQRRLVGVVRPHPDAAERGAERRVVHRDQSAEPRLGLVADHDLLVLGEEPQRAASLPARPDLRPDLRALGEPDGGEEAGGEAVADARRRGA